jgi:hypothetical protein
VFVHGATQLGAGDSAMVIRQRDRGPDLELGHELAMDDGAADALRSPADLTLRERKRLEINS